MLPKPPKIKSIFKYINPLYTTSYFSPPSPFNTPNLVKLTLLNTKDYKP